MAATFTEEEAKTKWCPFARVGSEYEPGFSLNRITDGPVKPAACIASRCMAWRKKMQDGSGFCGLAGQEWA